MSIPPALVKTARIGWNLQWKQLMKGLAPADQQGNYQRPPSQKQNASPPTLEDIQRRSEKTRHRLIIGRSCPWAHRTWLVHQLRNLHSQITILTAKVDKEAGLWKLEPTWLGCDSLLSLYKACGTPPNHRATVPALIAPGIGDEQHPQLLGNESAQLVETLNQWPSMQNTLNLEPKNCKDEIKYWNHMLQSSVNDGVYRCGFARTQTAYNKASQELFHGLKLVEKSLSKKGPWLCGKKLTLADVRLFPTLIRWENIYMPLFKCTQEPLSTFPNICRWRSRFFSLPLIAETCNAEAWREDYFGSLFPLHPSNIVPAGPELSNIVSKAFRQKQ